MWEEARARTHVVFTLWRNGIATVHPSVPREEVGVKGTDVPHLHPNVNGQATDREIVRDWRKQRAGLSTFQDVMPRTFSRDLSVRAVRSVRKQAEAEI